MGIGNILAVAQTNLKRMLAYSAISHIGFILLGLCSGFSQEQGVAAAYHAYSAALFYLVTYLLATLGTFGLIMLLSRPDFESDCLEDFCGLNHRSPWLAFMMMILMLSMAGIPFFVGFFAKFAVLSAVVIQGQYWLAVLAVAFSLIGAFYYLRVIKVMYFDEPPAGMPAIAANLPVRIVLSANSLAVALLGLFPQTLMLASTYVFLAVD
jgi:NADH-quinone oxidoreductase subunit N